MAALCLVSYDGIAPVVVVGSLGRKQSGATKVTSAVTSSSSSSSSSSSNSASQRILSPTYEVPAALARLAFPFIGEWTVVVQPV